MSNRPPTGNYQRLDIPSVIETPDQERLRFVMALIRHGRDPLSMTHKALLIEIAALMSDGDPYGAGSRLLDALCILYRYPEPAEADA